MWLLRLSLAMGVIVAAVAAPFNIVIDAGSTGCRLYVYQEEANGLLKGTTGPKVKPGLSTFTTHPADLKEFIKPLFVEAQSLIPQNEWSRTPVHIKATAGMRLVTPEQERVIYDTVHSFLSSTPDVCPFVVERASLRTITGAEEGFFGALSANYLSGVIDKDRALLHPDHASSVLGALDLGGSSTQVALHTAAGPAAGPSKKEKGAGAGSVESSDFFVHSYLGFGVEKMAEKYAAHLARKGLTHDPCAPPGWVAPGQAAGAAAVAVGSGHYDKCKVELAVALGLECGANDDGRCVMDGVALPPVAPEAKFIGMSVYFFALRSVFLTLAKTSATQPFSWPSPSLVELRSAASSFCAVPWSRLEALARDDSKGGAADNGTGMGWERFMGDAEQRLVELPERCIQAAYIDLLLGSVYGVPPDKHNVMIALDINSMEVEWTLGSVLASSSDGSEVGSEAGAGAAGAGPGGHTAVDAVLVFLVLFVSLAAALLCLRVGFQLASGRKTGRAK